MLTPKDKENPREDWIEALKEMVNDSDEKMLIPDIFKDEEVG